MALTTRSGKSQVWDFLGRYQVSKDENLFLDRFRWVQTPWFAVYTTRIWKDDTDRDPHDHSRSFLTFILTGSYTEEVWADPSCMYPPGASGLAPGVTRHHRRFSLRFMSRSWAHQITDVSGPLRTLMVAGTRRKTWHFWTPAGPVDWRDHG